MVRNIDGHGLVMLRQHIDIAVISGRSSKAVSERMGQLGIERVYQGQRNKMPAFEELLRDVGVASENVCYVGDDIPDLVLMKRVGLPIAVANGVPQVREAARWVTRAGGGHGAVREVCELILRARGEFEAMIDGARDLADSNV